ncbi:family 16 glycosylhydrolase [Kribbella sp. NPDC051586]|uniref:glycoside hydrolase family 16 protein n=1 Tax=Kribbella sp. NPDC051586 TaxID=3364118 RepID=UPI00378B8205
MSPRPYAVLTALCLTTAPLLVTPTTASGAAPEPKTSRVDPATPRGAQPLTKPLAPGKTQTLVFSDEFDGTVVDSTKWTKRDWARTGTVAPDTWSYDPANVTTDGNGALAIRIQNPSPTVYTGGGMDSKGKFDYTYGTLEARVHIPPTNGHLGAVWALPTNGLAPGGVVDGTARDGAEMDIMESNSQADQYNTSLHWDAFSGPDHQSSAATATAPALHTTWYHTFGLTWTADKLEYTYDGTVVRTVTDPVKISQVKEYPVLSHEILDAWADGSIHDEVFDSTSNMYVDYIRIWQ